MNSNFDWIKDMLEKLGIQPDAECETEVAADAEQENVSENNRASTLQLAIAWGNVEIVRLLVEYGAKLDGINVDGLDGEIKTILEQQISGNLVPVYKVDAKKKKKK